MKHTYINKSKIQIHMSFINCVTEKINKRIDFTVIKIIQVGRTPEQYSDDILPTIEHEELKKNILDFYTRVYVDNTNFDYRLRSAATVRFDVQLM